MSTSVATGIKLRPGKPEDAKVLGAICYEAFASIADRHNFPRDFPSAEVAEGLMSYLFANEDVYSVVAENEGRVVGSNFLWEGAIISGVGPVTVDPSAQNGAIGRRLMEDVMRRAKERGAAGVRLVQAAYHNRSLSLYAKLGFDAREPLSALQGPALELKIEGRAVRAAREEDVAACNDLHERVHGFTRERELRGAIEHGAASVVESGSRITGYTTGVGFMGYAVGESDEDLKALIGAAKEFQGPGLLLPTRNAGLLRWCLSKGLRIVMPMTLMSAGLYNEPRGAFLPSVIY